MIDITNIEYNLSSFFVAQSLLTNYTFCVDSFKPDTPNKSYCIAVDGGQSAGDQGRSLETIRATIKVRADYEYEAKEAACAVYQKAAFFGFGMTLPLYTDGEGFTVAAKDVSLIKATNAPIFLQSDDNGRAVYILSVEIKLSSS